MPPWNAPKAKVQLRLSVQRLRTLQEKKGAQAKAARRDIAVLLERGKLETARIKTENIINDDIYVELLELLELYCELLLARFGLLEQNTREPDAGIKEGVCSVIHAAPRTELKELHVLRDLLMNKYGRDFAIAAMENTHNCVSERVIRKTAVGTPSSELVDAYLGEIAKGYNINWSPPKPSNDDDADADVGGGPGIKEPAPEQPPDNLVPPILNSSDSETNGGSGIAISPSVQGKSKDKGDAKEPRLPDIPPTESSTPPGSNSTTPAADASKGQSEASSTAPVDEFEALRKRFDALKKR